LTGDFYATHPWHSCIKVTEMKRNMLNILLCRVLSYGTCEDIIFFIDLTKSYPIIIIPNRFKLLLRIDLIK